MKAPFIGRDFELKQLDELLDKQVPSLVAMRGRRRIGKSRLVREFAKNKTFYEFSGLAPEDGVSAQDQRNEFARLLGEQTGLPELQTDDWSKLFSLLNERIKRGRVILFLDEISWMGQDDPTFLPKLKNAWDLYFSRNSKLVLILCGSVSTWIENNIINSTAFFGRISLDVILKEISLPDCNDLLNQLGFKRSSQEKMHYLALTGCVPWYLELINPEYSAADNIRKLCFEPNAILINEYQRIFHDLFGRRGDIYSKIIKALVKQALGYSELSSKVKYPKGSAFSSYLEDLEISGYIQKFHTWDIAKHHPAKQARFRLRDNYLRFYFKFISPKLKQIEKNQFSRMNIDQLLGWRTLVGLQFENLVLNNRDIILKNLNIAPHTILQDDPYFQAKTARSSGCQIDYLVQTESKTLYACEIKSAAVLKPLQIIKEMEEKLKSLSLPRGFAVLPVLIHFSELDDDSPLYEYFHRVIDLRMCFS